MIANLDGCKQRRPGEPARNESNHTVWTYTGDIAALSLYLLFTPKTDHGHYTCHLLCKYRYMYMLVNDHL